MSSGREGWQERRGSLTAAKEKVERHSTHSGGDSDADGGSGGTEQRAAGGGGREEGGKGEARRCRRGKERLLPSVDLCVVAWPTWRLALRKVRRADRRGGLERSAGILVKAASSFLVCLFSACASFFLSLSLSFSPRFCPSSLLPSFLSFSLFCLLFFLHSLPLENCALDYTRCVQDNWTSFQVPRARWVTRRRPPPFPRAIVTSSTQKC